MQTIEKIESFQTNINVIFKDMNKGTKTISFDGQRGVFTRSEWEDSLDYEGINEPEDKELVLDYLERLEVIV